MYLFLACEAVAQTLLGLLLGQPYKTLTPAHQVTMDFCFVFFLHIMYYRNATFRLSQVTKRKTFKTDHKINCRKQILYDSTHAACKRIKTVNRY